VPALKSHNESADPFFHLPTYPANQPTNQQPTKTNPRRLIQVDDQSNQITNQHIDSQSNQSQSRVLFMPLNQSNQIESNPNRMHTHVWDGEIQ
jgi:hypothetical protein